MCTIACGRKTRIGGKRLATTGVPRGAIRELGVYGYYPLVGHNRLPLVNGRPCNRGPTR